ncbi:MAG: D-alanine--D-alanine ligase [Pseudohongiellaceae bacterium]
MSKLLAAEEYGRVAVVMGGTSAEREVSLLSGAAVLDSLLRSGVNAIGIDADRSLLQKLRDEQVERVVIMLHGRDGEDGKLQGALEWMGLPYTGSGVLASALAMDKQRSKLMWQRLGISTPPFHELDAGTDFAQVLRELGPCFVKPVNEGSSIGIGGAETVSELMEAWRHASQYDSRVIAESWVKGREFSVALLDEKVLPVIELRSPNKFYDYAAKYISDKTGYVCPAALTQAETSMLQQMALEAYRSIGCSGWGRVDAMQDAKGQFWLLEVNTAPGMTSHSLVPMAARAQGLDFDALVMRILHTSTHDRSLRNG